MRVKIKPCQIDDMRYSLNHIIPQREIDKLINTDNVFDVNRVSNPGWNENKCYYIKRLPINFKAERFYVVS